MVRPTGKALRGGKDEREMAPPDLSNTVTIGKVDPNLAWSQEGSKQKEVDTMTTHTQPPTGRRNRTPQQPRRDIPLHQLANQLPDGIKVITAEEQRRAGANINRPRTGGAPKPQPKPHGLTAAPKLPSPPVNQGQGTKAAQAGHQVPEETEGAVLTRADSILENAELLRTQLNERLGTLTGDDPVKLWELEQKMLGTREEDAERLVYAWEINLMHKNGSQLLTAEHVEAAKFVADNMRTMNPTAIPLAERKWANSKLRMRIDAATKAKQQRADEVDRAIRARIQGQDEADPETFGSRITIHEAIKEGKRGLFVQPLYQNEAERTSGACPLGLLEASDGPNEGDVRVTLVLFTPNVAQDLRAHRGESLVFKKHHDPALGVYFQPQERAKDPFGLLRTRMQGTFTAQKMWAENQARIEEQKLKKAERRAMLVGFAQNARPLFELLKGEAGVAVVEFPNYYVQTVNQAGQVSLYIEGDGTRLFLKDWEAGDPPRGRNRIDLRDFPKDGIPIKEPDQDANGLAYLIRHRLYAVAGAEIWDLIKATYDEWANHEGSLLPFRDGGRGTIKLLLAKFPVEALGRKRVEVPVALVVHGTSRNYKVLKAFCPCFEIPSVEELIPLDLDPASPDLVALLEQKPEVEFLVRLLRVALAKEAREQPQPHRDGNLPAEASPPTDEADPAPVAEEGAASS